MKKIFWLTALVFIYTISHAQGIKPVDSIRIAFLKKNLATASGRREVDLLNDIAWEYAWAGKDKTPAKEFALAAQTKAMRLKYQKGLALAMLTLSFNKMADDPNLSDSLCNEAAVIGEKINDPAVLARSYHRKWDMRKAVIYYRKAGDLEGEAEACTWLCQEFRSDPKFKEDEFSYCQRAVELAQLKWKRNISWGGWLSQMAYENMALLYNKVGDYSTALQLLKRGVQYSDAINLDNSFAQVYSSMGKYDSSVFYQERQLKERPEDPRVSGPMAEIYLAAGRYKDAVPLFIKSIEKFGKRYELQAGKWFIGLGSAYYHLNQIDSAFKYGNYGYGLAQKSNKMEDLKNASRLLSDIYRLRKDYEKAYEYISEYSTVKDSLENNRNMWRLSMQLSNYKKAAEDQKRTSQLQLLNKENQLKAAKLKQETFMKNSLTIGLVLILLIGFFTFRVLYFKRKAERLRRQQLENEMALNELKSRQEQGELQRKATELEMQALRAQMNPHFIFNCLSSINRFVLKNETDTASDYLTRFSRLIRLVLINSQKPLVTLEDELEMLRLYLDMERLRFKNAFDYNITFANSIEAGNVLMPPLLLQPFCENAIWHGLMHKEGQGRLDIVLTMEGKILHCTITDNGIGRKRAAEIRSQYRDKDKSFGLKITSDRLALLNGDKDIDTSYKISDLYDDGEASGTQVSLKISCNEMIAERDTTLNATSE